MVAEVLPCNPTIMSSLSVRRRINMDAAASPGSTTSMQLQMASPMKQTGKRQIGTVNERIETAGDFDSPPWQPGKLQKLDPVPALDDHSGSTVEAKLNFLHSALVDRFAMVDKHLETLCGLTNVLVYRLGEEPLRRTPTGRRRGLHEE